MRVLVTGAGGMLGQALTAVLAQHGHQVTAADRAVLDVTSARDCAQQIAGHDAVVNAAAWTAVDDAQAQEAGAFAVNAVGAATVARASREHGVRLLHISTDYVFAGDASTPYPEDGALAPKSAYGRTKAAGEWAVRAECPEAVIVRTAWLYGAGGPNFVTTLRRLAGERETVDVVDDQHGQPTWSADVARCVVALLDVPAGGGVVHATSSGQTTWFGLARAVFEELGLDPARVHPTTTAAFPRPAPRPAYSVLGHDRSVALGIPPAGPWRESLHRFLSDHH